MDPNSNSAAENAAADAPDRRGVLGTGAALSMLAGLGAGYGTLAAMAGRYLYSVQADKAWLFVTTTDALGPGETIDFESPTGVRVTVIRRAAAAASREPAAEDFSALSSVCPHLGCRVHWEAQNNRYFCPCHNGVFDPEGRAIDGPPAAAHQELPRYSLRVESGMLFIEMPLNAIGLTRNVFVARGDDARREAGDSA